MSLFKLLNVDAIEPTRATHKSVGYDLTATDLEWDGTGGKVTYKTGVGVGDIPEGYFIAIFPRSSISDTNLRLSNSVGVIDPDYTGEIIISFDCPLSAAMVISKGNARCYKVGDKIAQAVLLPYLTVDVTTPTEERTGGFGSTTKKKVKIES